MLESDVRISENKMSKPDSFFTSLLDSLHGFKANVAKNLEDQNLEMVFSESSETVESMNVKNDISPSVSEWTPAATVRESKTEHTGHEENVVALTEQSDPLSVTFFVALASEIMSSLTKTREYARFSEKAPAENGSAKSFWQIANDIEKIERLLDVYIAFLKINTPAREANTVHSVIENVLKKHGDKLKEKNLRPFRKFENDLPEIIVHHKQLEYILDHLLQYIIGLISPNADIGFYTSSRTRNKMVAQGQQAVSDKDPQYVYISVVLTGCREPVKQFGKKPRLQDDQQGEMLFSLMMRFIEETVRKNQGMLKVETDEEKKRTLFTMRFPVVRASGLL